MSIAATYYYRYIGQAYCRGMWPGIKYTFTLHTKLGVSGVFFGQCERVLSEIFSHFGFTCHYNWVKWLIKQKLPALQAWLFLHSRTSEAYSLLIPRARISRSTNCSKNTTGYWVHLENKPCNVLKHNIVSRLITVMQLHNYALVDIILVGLILGPYTYNLYSSVINKGWQPCKNMQNRLPPAADVVPQKGMALAVDISPIQYICILDIMPELLLLYTLLIGLVHFLNIFN